MDFQREQILKNILEDKDVKTLVEHHQISAEVLENNLLSLFSYSVSKKKCDGCQGINNCSQDMIGSMPKICYNGAIYTEFIPCPYMQTYMDKNSKKANLITLACNLDTVDPTSLFPDKPARKFVYTKMMSIFNKAMAGEQVKGIYLHGPYGCGKSYIMACFANKFAENGKKVVFAYFPDLIRQIKSAITTGGLEEVVETLKEADVLFLDDFGGETTTSFIRDEVLGAVLQERMENHKLTFMTSNLDHASLHNHLAETAKDVDELKASRIEERIRILMEFVELNDSNYRK